MRLANIIAQDVRFQFRHGFYYAYVFLSLIYIVLLRLLPANFVHPALTLILFSDVCTLGFFFIGAVVLLERGQNITESLFITPLRLGEYLFAKQFSFLLLSLMSTLLIMVGAWIGGQDFPWFIAGVILSGSLYTLFGLAFAAKARNVNDYFGRALGAGLLISLPIAAYLGFYDTPLFYLFPTRPTLILLDVLQHQYSFAERLNAVVSLLVWLGLLSIWTFQRFNKHVIHPA